MPAAPSRGPPGDSPLRYRDQAFDNVTVTKDLQYGSAPDGNGNPVALKLDLYQPTGDTQTKRPAIVWVHGGSFCCGDKTSPEIVDEANTFANSATLRSRSDSTCLRRRILLGRTSARAPA